MYPVVEIAWWGITPHDEALSLAQLLYAYLPRSQLGRDKASHTLDYENCRIGVTSTEKPDTYSIVVFSRWEDRDIPLRRSAVLITIQDVFCILERQGVRLIWRGGFWAGHKGEFIQYNQRGG